MEKIKAVLFLLGVFLITKSVAQDACTDGATVGVPSANDPDGDGINNECDLDDDNDGILDVNECVVMNFTSRDPLFWTIAAANINTANIGLHPQIDAITPRALDAISNLYSGQGNTISFDEDPNYALINLPIGVINSGNLYDDPDDTPDAGVVFEELLYEDTVWAIDGTFDLSGIDVSVYTEFELSGYFYADDELDIYINGSLVGEPTNNYFDDPLFFSFTTPTNTLNNGVNTIRLIINNNFNSTSGVAFNFDISFNCNSDIDNDGIANSIDLDSDNDGCPDALEGSALETQIGYTELTSETSIAGGVDAGGVPIIALGGQALGTSNDDSIQALECNPCNSNNIGFVDTDSDLVGDFCDLDDDNDGITDIVESLCETNLEVNSPNYVVETDLSTGISGSLTGLAALGTNSISFNYTLNGTGVWSDGVQIRDLGGQVGANTLFLRPEFVSNGNGFATYEFVFTTPVVLQNMTFGGLENDDRLVFKAYNENGNLIPLTAANFVTTGAVVSVGNDYTYVGQLPTYSTANFVNEIVRVSINQNIKKLVVFSDKADNGNNANSIEVYNFSYCIPIDTDNDTVADALDSDSDDDGCNDVKEAGFTDANDDGFLGTNPVGVNSEGIVVSGTDGYTTPADVDANTLYDFQEAGVVPAITVQPQSLDICMGCSGSFSVVATNAETYQWQVFNTGTANWDNLTDSGIYSGSTTPTLTLNNVTTANHNNLYRVVLSNSLYVCTQPTSTVESLVVTVNTVVSNRQRTYRVNKN